MPARKCAAALRDSGLVRELGRQLEVVERRDDLTAGDEALEITQRFHGFILKEADPKIRAEFWSDVGRNRKRCHRQSVLAAVVPASVAAAKSLKFGVRTSHSK